jgi:hypothetical protein
LALGLIKTINMTTVIEIIDTAVKIGFGAAITGLATYFVNKSNHKNEIKKEYVANKVNLLKECAFKLDKSSSLRNQAFRSITHIQLTEGDESTSSIKEHINLISDSFNILKEARIIATLINEKDIDTLFSKYLKTVSEINNHITYHGLKTDIKLINSKVDICEEASKQILLKLGQSLESIYT